MLPMRLGLYLFCPSECPDVLAMMCQDILLDLRPHLPMYLLCLHSSVVDPDSSLFLLNYFTAEPAFPASWPESYRMIQLELCLLDVPCSSPCGLNVSVLISTVLFGVAISECYFLLTTLLNGKLCPNNAMCSEYILVALFYSLFLFNNTCTRLVEHT